MSSIYVAGLGLSSPAYPHPQAWAERQASATAQVPDAALIPAAIRRRTSTLTRMIAQAVAQAAQGGADLASIPTIYASAYGEIATTCEILRQMATDPDGLCSPTLFHNSVHNTAAGYVSISTKNRSFSTSIAAGRQGLAMGLVEAIALLGERGHQVLLVLADEPLPAPFTPRIAFAPLAMAFHLSAEKLPVSRARLSNLSCAPETSESAKRYPFPGDLAKGCNLEESLAAHPGVAGLLLMDALIKRVAGTYSLSPMSGDSHWSIDIEPI